MENNQNMDIVKTNNQIKLLKYIVSEREISRSELSQLTNLSKASISSNVSTLLEDSLIYESHMGESSESGGRRPIYLKFNPNAGSIMSIDIKNDSIESILTRLNGEVLHHVKLSNYKIDEHSIMKELYSIIDQHIEHQPDTPHGIIGIGIAIHGVVSNHIIKFTPNYNLENLDIYNKIYMRYNIPVFIENEANLGALGEFVFSENTNSLININIHNGVGAGIIKDKNLLKSKSGYVGEIGHSILFPKGKACPCGNNGCLEQYISNRAIINKVSEHKNIENLTLEKIIEYGLNKDDFVLQVFEQSARYLSIGINNLICFYNPEVIVINSRLYNNFPHLLDIVKENLVSRITQDSLIKLTKIEGKSTLYGCTALVLHNFLKFKNLNTFNFKINVAKTLS